MAKPQERFQNGDNIAGESITTGKYLGIVDLYDKKFHKVFDHAKDMTVFIPLEEVGKLRKLPSQKSAEKHLKIFEQSCLLDTGEIEGSRYKYYKEKLSKSFFKSSLEVLHDLYILMLEKKITVGERKMYLSLKEKMLHEISFVLNMSADEAEEKYLN